MTNFKVKFSQVDNSFKVKFGSLQVVGASEEFNLQVKPSVVPTKEKQRIEPDDGFYGLEYQEVEPIPDEYIVPSGTKDITKNGEVDVTEYKTANVNIPERKEEQEATVNITKNGTTEIFPDENKVLSKATVNVNVPIPDGYIKPDGSMDINENGTFDVTEKAEVNVQVVAELGKPYIDTRKITDYSQFFATKGFDLSFLYEIDTSNCVNFSGFLAGRNKEFFEVPYLDTSKGINFTEMFNYTKILTIPQIDVRNGVRFDKMFRWSWIEECPYLNSDNGENFLELFTNSYITHFGGLNTENGTNFQDIFSQCGRLTYIGSELDFGKAINVKNAFLGCAQLTEVRFKNIKVFDNNLSFSYCSKLTIESLLSILNALSDNSELDETYTVYLGSANLAKLTQEQKMIAYSKNIALA